MTSADFSLAGTHSHGWIRFLARTGYASRSLVNFIIGLFAILSGFGHGGETDSKGALRLVLEQPFGKVMVGLLIVGMSGYVLWRLIQSLLDTDSHGWTLKGLAIRAGRFAGAIAYGVLTVYALSLLGVLPYDGASSSTTVSDSIASIIGTRPLLLLMLIVISAVAAAYFFQAYTEGYARHFDKRVADMDLVHPIAKMALCARGTVFALIALLLFYRFMTVNPTDTQPPGLSEALDFVQQLPAGDLLLMLLGVGFLIFSAYSACEALWRPINVEDAELEGQLD